MELPPDVCALIASYIGCDESGDYFRELALWAEVWDTQTDGEFTYTYCNGLLESKNDKAAVMSTVFTNARYWWYHRGLLHRDNDEPAMINADGTLVWLKNGLIHRDGDKPAVVNKRLQYATYYKQGKYHRDSGKPAMINHSAEEQYWVNGERHRDDGLPAVVRSDGHQEWHVRGRCHRDGGLAAVIYARGTRLEWWIDGQCVKCENK